MKRALFLSAIMICFGSFIFADPYFSLDGRTVFFLVEQQTYNGVTSDVTQGWGGRDWASGGPQIDVGCGWIDKKMEYHFKIRLLNNLVDKDNDIIVNEAFAVAKIVPDFFSVSVGYRQDYDEFRKNTPIETDFLGLDYSTADAGRMNGWGVIFIVAPKDSGFIGALQYRLPIGTFTGYVDDSNAIDPLDQRLVDNLYNTSLALSYTLRDLFKLTAGSGVGNGDYSSDANALYPNMERNIFLRAELLMVKDLTLWGCGSYAGFEADTPAHANTEIRATLGASYKISGFKVNMGAELQIETPKAGGDSITRYYATLEPTYNFGAITVGIGGQLRNSFRPNFTANPIFLIMPFVKFNEFNIRTGFNLRLQGSNILWAVPILIEIGF
jgi:hypothetical protein